MTTTSTSSKLKRRYVAIFSDARLAVYASDRRAAAPKVNLNLLQATGVCLLNAAASAPRGMGLSGTLVDEEAAIMQAGYKVAVADSGTVTVLEAFDDMQMASLVSELAHHVRAASVVARGVLLKRSALMWKRCVRTRACGWYCPALVVRA